MEQFKTYTIKAKESNAIWIFKYYLEGGLRSFVVLDGSFDDKQANWLFMKGRFPHNESIMKKWLQFFKKHFEIEIGIPEITFDYFYNTYGKKTTKKQASDFWKKKMTDAERINAVLAIRKYKNFCKMHNDREQVDPVRYLKHRRYEDEF
jgi:hypothetical protein